MNVFLGLRYGIWSAEEDPAAIADTIAAMLAKGLARHD
jgi:hypothetical protein